jgi:hypothetical protein
MQKVVKNEKTFRLFQVVTRHHWNLWWPPGHARVNGRPAVVLLMAVFANQIFVFLTVGLTVKAISKWAHLDGIFRPFSYVFKLF